MRVRNILLLLIVLGLSGCDFIRKYQLGDAVVKAGDAALYESDIMRLTEGMHGEDSLRFIETYIKQWATDELVYESARGHSENKQEIERMVDDYRRSLYAHEWVHERVEQRMPKAVSEDSIHSFYEQHQDRFVLREGILKGVFIVVPLDAPEQMLLKLWLKDLSEENIELIEKYAYQYATGYEFFVEDWQAESGILPRMQIDEQELYSKLKQSEIVEMADTMSVCLLRVTDKRRAGEVMPEEYASKTIEHILLEQRQKAFIDKQKEELYQTAVRRGRVIIKN